MPGYALTKLVSEILISHAKATFPSSFKTAIIFRPSTISGDSSSGFSNITCFTNQILCGLLNLQKYPTHQIPLVPSYFLFTPVDFVSYAITCLFALLSQAGHRYFPEYKSGNEICYFHLVPSSPTSWSDVLSFVRSFGLTFAPVDNRTWEDTVATQIGEGNQLFLFKDYLKHGEDRKIIVNHHHLGPAFKNTLSLLQKIENCQFPRGSPAITESMFHAYLLFFINQNMIVSTNQPSECTTQPQSKDLLSSAVENKNYLFENWYPRLEKYTIPSRFFSFPQKYGKLLQKMKGDMNRMMEASADWQVDEIPKEFILEISEGAISSTGKIQSAFSLHSRATVSPSVQDFDKLIKSFRSVISAWQRQNPKAHGIYVELETQIQLILNNFQESGAFIRLSTRSPKDSEFKFHKLADCLEGFTWHRGYLSNSDNLKQILQANIQSLRVRTVEDVFLTILQSERIFEDLRMCESFALFPIQFIARKFTQLEPHLEFRLFVFRKTLTACSIYHKHYFFPELLENKETICNTIVNFFPTIQDDLPDCLEDYALDVILHPSFKTLQIIELNYAPPIASCILFDWYNVEDRKILQSGPFELRLVTAPSEGLEHSLKEASSLYKKYLPR